MCTDPRLLEDLHRASGALQNLHHLYQHAHSEQQAGRLSADAVSFIWKAHESAKAVWNNAAYLVRQDALRNAAKAEQK